MSEQEMLLRIKELEAENERLKGMTANKPYSIIAAMGAQKELDFIVPTYHMGRWKRSTLTTEFAPLRKLAMSVVNKPSKTNSFTEQKVKDLSDRDFSIVLDCADELAKVVVKYKKAYLMAIDRKDIVDAFNM